MIKRLYHFTAVEYLPVIVEDGLWKGDIPHDLSVEGFGADNGVWFTDRKDSGRGADNGLYEVKRCARIAVDLDSKDPLLYRWLDYAKVARIRTSVVKALHRAGGGQSSHWYVYKGNIPSDLFVDIGIRSPYSLASGYRSVPRSDWRSTDPAKLEAARAIVRAADPRSRPGLA